MMTFGNLISDVDATTHYGFVYKIKIGIFEYIGKKEFNSKSNWKYYFGSGIKWKKIYATMIARDFTPIYEIICYCDNPVDLQKMELTSVDLLDLWK